MLITLKREAVCDDCGSDIPAGSKARWYRDGKAYGLTCHEQIKPKKAAKKKAAKKRAARRVIPQTNGDGEVNWVSL